MRARSTPRLKLLLAALVLALPEAVYWAGGTFAATLPPPGDCAVLVLGFPTRKDGSPSDVQRYRVETAAGFYRAQKCDLMVLAGGSPHSPYVESETMARLAVAEGVPAANVAVETRSRNTWENIAFALPQLEKKPTVLLVSDSLHALRAKRYWCRQRPDLCGRAYPSTRYVPLRLYWMKWVGMIGETANRVRDELRAAPKGPPATRPGTP